MRHREPMASDNWNFRRKKLLTPAKMELYATSALMTHSPCDCAPGRAPRAAAAALMRHVLRLEAKKATVL